VKRVIFCGHGRAGKDTACEMLATVTTLRNAGTTSKYLAAYVADKLGVPIEVAYASRHESRELWYRLGNELREKGASTLVRMALEHGEITGGIRDLAEIRAVRSEGLVDLIVWVDNCRVEHDPTVKFDEQDCDLILPNHWSLNDLRTRIERLARFAGLPMRNQ
jgi:hypothetical protein